MKVSAQQHFGGLNIGVLVNDGFEQTHLSEPRRALEEVGAIVKILSARAGTVQARHGHEEGDVFAVDLSFDKARADDFDALLLPGGTGSAVSIGSDPGAQRLVRNVDKEGKPIGALGDGALLLVAAGLVKGRKLAGGHGPADRVPHVGAHWVNETTMVDGNWVSNREPGAVEDFVRDFMHVLGKRVKDSVQGTADGLPGAAGTGG